MRISELMILLNKYYSGEDKKLTIRHDKPRRYGEGRRVGIYMEDAGFRVDEYTEPGSSWYGFHTCEFRREGAAVYYLLNRSVALNPTEHQLVGLYETRGDDHFVRFIAEESVDYGRGSFGHDKSTYRHEGHVVYRNFNSVTFRNDFSLDYELLYYGDPLRCKYIGLIIKLEGKWRVYIADSHMFVLDNDFESAKEAKEYAEACIKEDPFMQELIEQYVKDME